MKRSYRADQVGSFLRPREIREARNNPSSSTEQLRDIEDRHILRALERQKDLGFRIFTDGELRRSQFMGDFYESVEGLDQDGSIARAWKGQAGADPGGGAAVAQLTGLVVGKLRQTKRLTKHEVDFLLASQFWRRQDDSAHGQSVPGDRLPEGAQRKSLRDVLGLPVGRGPIIKSEIQALVDEGVAYVQIDAPRYSYYLDPKWRDYIRREMGVSPEDALDEAIRVDNACLEGARREGVTLAIHLCRGNSRSQWYAEGGYDPIAEKLFNELNVDLFLLEYESDRAGTFEPLRFVPPNKGVVLGLVSSKVPAARATGPADPPD